MMSTYDKETQDSVSKKLEKLKSLKNLKQKAIRLNREERQDDVKKQRAKTYEWKMKSKETQGGIDDLDKKDDDILDKKENWEYTLEECSNWDRKQKSKQRNKYDEYQNQDKLAEFSYKREVDNLKIDKDEYLRQKGKEKEAVLDGQKEQPLLIAPQTDIKARNKLAERIRQNNSLSVKRRKTDELDMNGEYINHKNKQFNLKLDRDYKN